MTRTKIRTSAAIALCCAATGLGFAGGSGPTTDVPAYAAPLAQHADGDPFTGTKKITVADRSVNVSCSGNSADGRPVVVLLHGGGDDLTTMADFQQALSQDDRVCSYDRLGAGASDEPTGPQDYVDVGTTLTGVLDQVVGDDPVVLAGHSMGGLIAARYAPDHQDRVRGLVLLDSTSPTAVANLTNRIPESATGPAGELRKQTLAVFGGQNPEQLVFTDGPVRPAGDIGVQVIQYGLQYLADVPVYGPGLEKDWTAGQEQWLALSESSRLRTARKSGHYIYLEAPGLAIRAVQRVASQAAAAERGST